MIRVIASDLDGTLLGRNHKVAPQTEAVEPLANEILLGQAKGTKEELAKAFVSPEKGVESTEDAILRPCVIRKWENWYIK